MYTGPYNSGLGFSEPTPPAAIIGGVNLFDPSTYGAALQSGGLLDTSQWDWHEYALAALAGYFVLSRLFRGTQRATSAVTGKVRKVKRGADKRAQALKTVFTG